MTGYTKIAFDHRKVRSIDDVTDLVTVLFPGNRNLQHAAARILLAIKSEKDIVSSLHELEGRFGISSRTLERARAKLARLGLIERVTWMNRRYGGRQGWKLSGRMGAGLRHLATKIDEWQAKRDRDRIEKEEILVEVLAPARTSTK